MAATEVIYYCEVDGSAPVLDWLKETGRRDRRAVHKCGARIEALKREGRELRRPLAEYLRDGIYELRVRSGRVQFRILYFFHGTNAVVLTHGLVKERRVPGVDIDRALSRKRKFERSPRQHTYHEETSNG